MKHQIRSGLAYCLVETRPVFLDVRQDRYFMIQGALESAFKAFLAGDALSTDSVSRLACAKILEPAAGSAEMRSPPTIIPPTHSVLEKARGPRRTGPISTIKAMKCLLRSRPRLKRDGFARCIERVHARKRDASSRSAARQSFVESRAAEFLAARRLFPAPQNCLPDSLALLDFLFEGGAVADFVIGVRMDPYGAHCWVQTKETLLNETVDYARSFTPILVA